MTRLRYSCLMGILCCLAVRLSAQETPAPPTTYAALLAANYRPLDAVRHGMVAMPSKLSRKVSVARHGVLLQQALLDIATQAGLGLSYGEDLARAETVVSVEVSRVSAADALAAAVQGTEWAVFVNGVGQVTVTKGVVQQNGTIVGRVTDAKTQTAFSGATVLVQGTSHSATTGSDGRYRIADVAPGTYTLRARYIGYAPGMASVTVSAGQEATADLALEKSAQRLDEVVTTGTVVPTEVKALPTAVSVVSDSDIARQRPRNLPELFRQAVPTGVSPDMPAFPDLTAISARGASTLNGFSGQMKAFVDGVEVVSPTDAVVDPSSIERVEVIRGPQAAAIYGSAAIGGVIQIFTKRGDPSRTRPQVDGEAALGAVQTPYPGYNGVLRQSYRVAVRGGGAEMGYNFGASLARTGDWVVGQPSAQSQPSVYGGVRYARGVVTADISGRYFTTDFHQTFNPALTQTGFSDFSRPYSDNEQNQFQGVGARLGVAPTSWWHNTLTIGVDRWYQDDEQPQARRTTLADTLLFVAILNETKTSLAFNTSVQGTFAPGLSGALTAGFDHYSSPITDWYTSGALTVTGTIPFAPDNPIFADRTFTTNTGYFVQGQLGVHDVLFLTAAVRAEQNSNFGDSLGTPLSPRFGASYVQSLGGATLKLRTSWGRAIRAPLVGFKLGSVTPTIVQLANPRIGPERQQGWDAGADLVFGGRGSLSVTAYGQNADGLIQQVLVSAVPVATYQHQNVGSVQNTGIEIEGALTAGPVQLKGQYGYARARVAQLSPTYTGDLRIGDQVLQTPKHTAGAFATVAPLSGTSVSAGVTYVGSQTYYDYVAEYACFGGSGPCQPGPGSRNYLIAYPGFVKVNATVSQRLTPVLSGFVSADNLTNNQAYETGNFFPVMGRITTVGLRFQY